jgi:DNA modification methylase
MKKTNLKNIEKLKIEEVDINSLSVHPLCSEVYQTYDIEGLKENMIKIGVIDPVLVVDQKDRIISGVRRYQSMKELGYEKIMVRRIQIDNVEVGYLIFSFNKQRVKSFSEILNEIVLLKQHYMIGSGKRHHLKNDGSKINWRTLAAKELGVSESQLNNMIEVGKNKDVVKEIDKGTLTINQGYEFVKRRDKQRREISDRIELETKKYDGTDVRVFCQSSKVMEQLKNGEVQMVFTSIPYFDLREYGNGIEGMVGNELDPETYVNVIVEHFKECDRVVNERGSIFININDVVDKKNKTLQNLPHKIAIKLMERYGWKLRQTIIWRKTNPIPSSSKTKITNCWEPIFWFVKSDNYKYNPIMVPTEDNKLVVCTPPRRITKDDCVSFIPMVSTGYKNIPDEWSEDYVKTSVYYEKDKDSDRHPAVFNKRIIFFPLLMTTDPGDLVLDNFCGSGTTLFLAQEQGRRAVGYDVQPKFVKGILKTLNKIRDEKKQNHEQPEQKTNNVQSNKKTKQKRKKSKSDLNVQKMTKGKIISQDENRLAA